MKIFLGQKIECLVGRTESYGYMLIGNTIYVFNIKGCIWSDCEVINSGDATEKDFREWIQNRVLYKPDFDFGLDCSPKMHKKCAKAIEITKEYYRRL